MDIIQELKPLLYKDLASKMYREVVLKGRGFRPKFLVITKDYDDLESEDIQAVLLFAARLSQVKSIHKIAS